MALSNNTVEQNTLTSPENEKRSGKPLYDLISSFRDTLNNDIGEMEEDKAMILSDGDTRVREFSDSRSDSLFFSEKEEWG